MQYSFTGYFVRCSFNNSAYYSKHDLSRDVKLHPCGVLGSQRIKASWPYYRPKYGARTVKEQRDMKKRKSRKKTGGTGLDILIKQRFEISVIQETIYLGSDVSCWVVGF